MASRVRCQFSTPKTGPAAFGGAGGGARGSAGSGSRGSAAGGRRRGTALAAAGGDAVGSGSGSTAFTGARGDPDGAALEAGVTLGGADAAPTEGDADATASGGSWRRHPHVTRLATLAESNVSAAIAMRTRGLRGLPTAA